MLIDAIIRFAGVGLIVSLILQTMGFWRKIPLFAVAGALAISIVAILINSAPAAYAIPDEARFLAKVLETPNGALFWWFGLLLFDDEFRPKATHLAVMAVYCVVSFSIRLRYFGIVLPFSEELVIAAYGLSFAMVGHLVWRVIKDGTGDLLEPRRSARRWFIMALAMSSTIIGIAELTLPHAYQSLLRASVLLPIVLWVQLWLTDVIPSKAVFRPTAPLTAPSKSTAPDPDLEKLRRLMTEEKVYLEPGLTIAGLSDRMGIPEHRLRKLINRTSGFGNFSGFINFHRVAHAKALLLTETDTPVTSIALDSGFASLPTFNRVFKNLVGQSPTVFRQKAAEGMGR